MRGRTFLFELLCFAGEYDRAEKQIDVLGRGSDEAEMGAWLYRAALQGESVRREMFAEGDLPSSGSPPPISGTLNGEPFDALLDADPRIGARLEVLAGGQYTWIPLEHVVSVKMEAPQRLRDLKWTPAVVQTGPGFQEVELGDVLLPATTPLACDASDDEVRLGRVTEWLETEDGTVVPSGQKLLVVDDEPFPFLELRELEVTREPSPDAS